MVSSQQEKGPSSKLTITQLKFRQEYVAAEDGSILDFEFTSHQIKTGDILQIVGLGGAVTFKINDKAIYLDIRGCKSQSVTVSPE